MGEHRTSIHSILGDCESHSVMMIPPEFSITESDGSPLTTDLHFLA